MLEYFLDEVGDTTPFGRYGVVLIGTEAVSRFFIVDRFALVCGSKQYMSFRNRQNPHWRAVGRVAWVKARSNNPPKPDQRANPRRQRQARRQQSQQGSDLGFARLHLHP